MKMMHHDDGLPRSRRLTLSSTSDHTHHTIEPAVAIDQDDRSIWLECRLVGVLDS